MSSDSSASRFDTLAATKLRLDGIDPACWNALAPDDQPFLRHEFLSALERTGCVKRTTGWVPQHVGVVDSQTRQLLGAAPVYLKYHSYGEYIFDWAWAQAYDRHGVRYYPKLVVAIPFTPAAGPRLLVHPDADAASVRAKLVNGVRRLAERFDASSIHWLFTSGADLEYLERCGFMTRRSTQFHWRNEGYADFDDYLANLASAKRKKIRRERRRVREQSIKFEWFAGAHLHRAHWLRFYECYTATIERHGAIPYLSLEFFLELGQRMPERCVLLFATQQGESVGSAFFVRGAQTLYGRYWGAVRRVPDLHFETCYYQPIDYCIRHGLRRFEAGAQGEHKLSRGLLPAPTYSAHWLRHPQFAEAVAEYLDRERRGVEQYASVLDAHSPFKRRA